MDREIKRGMIKAIKNAEYAIVITDKKTGLSDMTGKQVAILLGDLAFSFYKQGVPVEFIKDLFSIPVESVEELNRVVSKEEK